MLLADKPIDPRFLTQEDRIAIAGGLQSGRPAAMIAEEIGKHRATVYREIQRGRKGDGSYNPWWAHNQALVRRRRPKQEKLRASGQLNGFVSEKLQQRWSPQQISRQLARLHPGIPAMNASPETIYRALYAGLLDRRRAKLRTGRGRRKKQRRGIPMTNAIPNMRPIHTRPRQAEDRTTAGHWEVRCPEVSGQGSNRIPV
jgi:IS30 family transposase